MDFFELFEQSDKHYPVVVLAIKTRSNNGEMPEAIICDKEGKLSKGSKETLLCG